MRHNLYKRKEAVIGLLIEIGFVIGMIGIFFGIIVIIMR